MSPTSGFDRLLSDVDISSTTLSLVASAVAESAQELQRALGMMATDALDTVRDEIADWVRALTTLSENLDARACVLSVAAADVRRALGSEGIGASSGWTSRLAESGNVRVSSPKGSYPALSISVGAWDGRLVEPLMATVLPSKSGIAKRRNTGRHLPSKKHMVVAAIFAAGMALGISKNVEEGLVIDPVTIGGRLQEVPADMTRLDTLITLGEGALVDLGIATAAKMLKSKKGEESE